jgi:glutaredoxin-like protein
VIPLRDQEYLRARFARDMVGAVRIDHFTQRKLPIFVPGREECPFCEETQQTLKELAALSEKIRLNVHEFSESAAEAARLKVDKVPGTVIRGPLNRPIRFYGFPAGQEFPAFIEDIIDASRGKAELAPETVRQLRKLRREIAVQVFVTPACTHCPGVARLAHRMALESPQVSADVVEIGEFPRLAERYRVQAVPVIVIEERVVLVGAMEEGDLIAQIVQFAQGKTLQPAAGAVGASSPLEQRAPERREGGLILP